MAFKIAITEDADRQFQWLSAHEQRILQTAVAARLEHQPTCVSNAIKRLRPNPLAGFELRVGNLRALYNVEDDEVVIIAVGRKSGEKFIVEGKEFHGHQDHPAQPPGSEPGDHVE